MTGFAMGAKKVVGRRAVTAEILHFKFLNSVHKEEVKINILNVEIFKSRTAQWLLSACNGQISIHGESAQSSRSTC